MNIWFKLSPEQAHHFQVPWPQAGAADHDFYATTSLDNLYDADPWLLLSFWRHAQRERVVTFRPSTIRRQQLHTVDEFNPLTDGHNAMTLTRQELSGLVDLLYGYALHLAPLCRHRGPTFERVGVDQWSQFHIKPELTTVLRRRVYLQVADPLADLRAETAVSLLVVTLPPVAAARRGYRRPTVPRFTLQLRQFPLHRLCDPRFDPLQDAAGQIDLDRTAVFDLAMLLASLQTEFERASFWANERPLPSAEAETVDHLFSIMGIFAYPPKRYIPNLPG